MSSVCAPAPATPEGVCPRCGNLSRRVHAWHVRRVADLPLGGRSVVIELQVRRLVCQTIECTQRTFRQQVPELAVRYARRTLRLTATVGRLAITLAGRAGATVLAGLGMAISRSTVPRAAARRSSTATAATPRDHVRPAITADQ